MGGILQAIIDPGAVQRDIRQQDLQAEGLRLRNAELAQRAEEQRIENEQRQRALKDMDILSRAYVNTDRSPMAVQRYAISNGITPAGWKNHVEALKSAATLRKEEIEAENAVNTQIAQRLHAVTKAAPEARSGLWERTRAELLAHDPNLQLPDDPTEENLRPVMIGLGYHAVLTKEAEQLQKIANEKAQAERAAAAEKRAAELAPLTRAKTQAEIDRIQNPVPPQRAQVPGVDVPLPKEVEEQRIRISKATQKAAATSEQPSDLVDTVLAQPALYDTLTPTQRQKILPELTKRGFVYEGKPLSPEAQKVKENAESGLRALAKIETMIGEDPSVLVKSALPGSLGARQYAAAKNEVMDVITRLRTGAALNLQEQDFYAKQVPGLLDLTDKEAISYKIKQLRDLFTGLSTRKMSAPTSTAAPKIRKYNATTGRLE